MPARRWAAALLAALGLLALAQVAVAIDKDALAACIARNSVKYSDPGSAAVAQYVDVEAACRAALDDTDESGFIIAGDDGDAPGSGAAPAGGGGEGSGAAPAQPGGSGGDQAPAGGSGDDGAQTGDDGAAAAEPATPAAEAQDQASAEGVAGAGPTAVVIPASASTDGPFAGMPVWLVILVGAGIVAIVGVTVLDLRRRRGT
jgi:hypothetical protein